MKNLLIGSAIKLMALLSGCHENSSIGIIGGADGPTAVLITSDFNWWKIAASVVTIVVIIIAIILIFKKKK